jgi:hypothetical protein
MEMIYIQRDGETEGPYSQEVLQTWFETGKIPPQTPCRNKGEEEWMPLSRLFGSSRKFSCGVPLIYAVVAIFVGLFLFRLILSNMALYHHFSYRMVILSTSLLCLGMYAFIRIPLAAFISIPIIYGIDLLAAVCGMFMGMFLINYFEEGYYAVIFDPIVSLLHQITQMIF